jgi:hypothetical protein
MTGRLATHPADATSAAGESHSLIWFVPHWRVGVADVGAPSSIRPDAWPGIRESLKNQRSEEVVEKLSWTVYMPAGARAYIFWCIFRNSV